MKDAPEGTRRSLRRATRRIASTSGVPGLHITCSASAPHSGATRTRAVAWLAPSVAPCYPFENLRYRWSVSRSQRPCSALTVPSPSQNGAEVNGAR